MKTNKQGVSLIVLVITITGTYDEANKIDRNPPKNKKEIIYDNKVAGCELATFNFFKSIV